MSANDRQVGGDHYRSEFQHWDLIEESGVGYLEGCATKYVSRWRKKNGLQDLDKAAHYVEKLLNVHREWRRQPDGTASLVNLQRFKESNELNDLEGEFMQLLCGRWTGTSLLRALDVIDELRHSGLCDCEEE